MFSLSTFFPDSSGLFSRDCWLFEEKRDESNALLGTDKDKALVVELSAMVSS